MREAQRKRHSQDKLPTKNLAHLRKYFGPCVRGKRQRVWHDRTATLRRIFREPGVDARWI